MTNRGPIIKFAFSSTLEGVLRRHGISNYKFSEVSGLDGAHVSRLVRGLRSRPQPATMRKIDRALARLGVPDGEIDAVGLAAGFVSLGEKRTPLTGPSRPPVIELGPPRPQTVAMIGSDIHEEPSELEDVEIPESPIEAGLGKLRELPAKPGKGLRGLTGAPGNKRLRVLPSNVDPDRLEALFARMRAANPVGPLSNEPGVSPEQIRHDQ